MKTVKPAINPLWILLLLFVAVVLLLWDAGLIHIWEDGSFAIGFQFPYYWNGCIPWMPCGK